MYKPKEEKIFPWNIIEEQFATNKDGAGFFFKLNKETKVIKGLMTLKEIKKIYKAILRIKNYELMEIILHLRYSTHGKIIPSQTHPFPITEGEDFYNLNFLSTDKGYNFLFHNGVINIPLYEGLNDTQSLVLRYLTNNNIERTIELISNLNPSRFILANNKNITLYGKFVENEGCYYSRDIFYKTNFGKNENYDFYKVSNYNETYNKDYLIENTEEPCSFCRSKVDGNFICKSCHSIYCSFCGSEEANVCYFCSLEKKKEHKKITDIIEEKKVCFVCKSQKATKHCVGCGNVFCEKCYKHNVDKDVCYDCIAEKTGFPF